MEGQQISTKCRGVIDTQSIHIWCRSPPFWNDNAMNESWVSSF